MGDQLLALQRRTLEFPLCSVFRGLQAGIGQNRIWRVHRFISFRSKTLLTRFIQSSASCGVRDGSQAASIGTSRPPCEPSGSDAADPSFRRAESQAPPSQLPATGSGWPAAHPASRESLPRGHPAHPKTAGRILSALCNRSQIGFRRSLCRCRQHAKQLLLQMQQLLNSDMRRGLGASRLPRPSSTNRKSLTRTASVRRSAARRATNSLTAGRAGKAPRPPPGGPARPRSCPRATRPAPFSLEQLDQLIDHIDRQRVGL